MRDDQDQQAIYISLICEMKSNVGSLVVGMLIDPLPPLREVLAFPSSPTIVCFLPVFLPVE